MNIENSVNNTENNDENVKNVSENNNVDDEINSIDDIDCKNDETDKINTDKINKEDKPDKLDESINDKNNSQEIQTNENQDNENRKSAIDSFAKSCYDYVEIFVIAVCAVLVIFTFFFRLNKVDGPSMEKSLFDGEVLIVSNIFYKPNYGDIIIFHQTSDKVERYNELIVKRVIAKGGDEVMIDFNTWTLTVNGEIIEENYRNLSGGFLLKADYTFPVTVPEGFLFVMGDNRNNSSDSRDNDIGFVDERRVMGKAVFRLLPIESAGRLY